MVGLSLLLLYVVMLLELSLIIYLYVRMRSILGRIKDAITLGEIYDITLARLKDQDAKIAELSARVDVFSVSSHESTNRRDAQYNVSSREKETESTVISQADIGKGSSVSRVLRLLLDHERTAKDIMVELGCSREHAARLMKALYDRGYIERDEKGRPFVYKISDLGKKYIGQG